MSESAVTPMSPAPGSMTSRDTVDDAYVSDHMIRLGQGEPMLLIHGLGHCKEAWDPILPSLAATHDVCAIDLPGFGGATPLSGAPTEDALTDWCEQVMDTLGWDTAHIVGNSLGGLIGLLLGGRGRARSVTALSPGGQMVGWERTWAKGLLRVLHTLAPRLAKVPIVNDNARVRAMAMSTIFGRPANMSPAYARLSLDAVSTATRFNETFDAVSWEPQRPGPIDVPTTIAWGTRDVLLLPQQGRRWAEALPGSRLVKLPGLGHTPMPDDPAMVADVIGATVAAAA